MCFLYCAAFPEDAHIEVEALVEMWRAERLVPQKVKTYFMDVGREYINVLVDRCLIQYVDAEKEAIKVHDVLRDMAIYVGQKEENWLFLSGQHLQHFPSEEETRDRKRISVNDNEISDLPPDFKCPTLVSLVLAENRQLKEIPESFLGNVMSLKVLDLSDTSIQALPTTVGQLGQLEFLNLRGCDKLEELPDSICNLSHLQFLNLEDCDNLNSLPDRIGALKNLKHLKFSGSDKGVMVIPHQISQLTSLNKLVLPPLSTPMSVEDLTNLSNLIELDATVKPEIKGGSMSTWSEMRKLRLRFDGGEDDDAALDILPQNMQSMKKLQSLELFNYRGVSLPNCICQFQNLKNLHLTRCLKLKELPALEIGNEAARGGFPMLEKLHLQRLDSLESIVWNANTMLQLQILKIAAC
jgi:disease resistance protein RPS2